MEPTATAVRTSVDDGIGVVTLADARRRNPLSVATMRALTAALRDAVGHEGVGAIVLDRTRARRSPPVTTCPRWSTAPSTRSARCSPSAPS